jgi:hypothetical protein
MAVRVTLPTEFDEPENNRRLTGRIRCHGVTCSYGEVLDISRSGLRIGGKRANLESGASLEFTLNGIDGPVSIKAKVAWVRPAEARLYEAGLELVEPTAEVKRALIDLARASAAPPLAAEPD